MNQYVTVVPGKADRSFRESELEAFEWSLRDTSNRYYRETGKTPTHLILGQDEAVKFKALVYMNETRGLLRPDLSGKRKHTFSVHFILFTDAQSMLVAAIDPSSNG